MRDDGWPHTWRSLDWFPLALGAAFAVARGAAVWSYRAVARHLLHETPRMKVR